MIIYQYDLVFQRLRQEHIEELRQWRNADKIRSRMEYREYITPEMQQAWFQRVNNIEQYLYLIMSHKGKRIGEIHAKEPTNNRCEAGMFIWDDEYVDTHYPVIASVLMSDLNFYFMQNLFVNCKTLKTNPHAIAYNKNFGFKLCDGQENMENQLYTLEKRDYESNAKPVRRMLKNIYKDMDDIITIQLEPEDEKNGVAESATRYYEQFDEQKSPVRFQLIKK
ncbi:MAG: GNAT family N-acetyltransferase [Bacteroidetes bacterium]|nr:GNAT family N-acetyltransferase [Bacteroidota bacterium]